MKKKHTEHQEKKVTATVNTRIWEKIRKIAEENKRTTGEVLQEAIKYFVEDEIEKIKESEEIMRGRPVKYKRGRKPVQATVDAKAWQKVRKLARKNKRTTGEILEKAIEYFWNNLEKEGGLE